MAEARCETSGKCASWCPLHHEAAIDLCPVLLAEVKQALEEAQDQMQREGCLCSVAPCVHTRVATALTRLRAAGG